MMRFRDPVAVVDEKRQFIPMPGRRLIQSKPPNSSWFGRGCGYTPRMRKTGTHPGRDVIGCSDKPKYANCSACVGGPFCAPPAMSTKWLEQCIYSAPSSPKPSADAVSARDGHYNAGDWALSLWLLARKRWSWHTTRCWRSLAKCSMRLGRRRS